ncbi:MAG TPA: uracil-DNA glycosylase [Alcanivoracaceae bacterium]|nr:uracil-DNA glycosylase [Alcanivoracaceae bacterium]
MLALPEQLDSQWLALLQREANKPYMLQLQGFIEQRLAAGATVYPPREQWFDALLHTPFEKVRVVLLGQDPYHGPGQAHGLSFSVPNEVPIPPSLRNIFRELVDDVGVPLPATGNLTPWAKQGVLLLNAVLTVEAKQAGSHAKQGWERLTDELIAALNEQREGLVFLLWGAYAQRKAAMIDASKHKIICAPHPSPLSAYRGFFGSKPFSQINAYFTGQQKAPIDWALNDHPQTTLF